MGVSLFIGISLFIGNCITDAMRRGIRQKLCRYNNLQNYSAPIAQDASSNL
jgi:hypothetical protein